MTETSFIQELRNRKVVQVAAIYGVVAWGTTEIIVTVVSQLFLPQWVSTLAVIGFVVGFPVAMFLAWTFDITPDGIQRTTVASGKGKASIAISMLLLVTGTAGLFLLIKPALVAHQADVASLAVVPNSLAVLPFEYVHQGGDDFYLSESFTDELRDQLGRVSGLRIAARSSSVAVRARASDAVAAAAALGVANLIEGSFSRRGNRLHISVQLIEGRTGLALWSETFDRSPKELLIVQQAIADQVVLQILPDAKGEVATPATRIASANELLLLARYHEQTVRDRPDVDEQTLLEAIRLYREAIEADPESALAHSRLAGALLYLGDVAGAEAPIFRALTLNPRLSEVQATLGSYYWARALPGAGVAWGRAVELNPNNADALALYAHWVWMNNYMVEDAEVYYRLALKLDPLSLTRLSDLGNFLGLVARIDETRKIIQRVEELFDTAPAYRVIARLLEFTGDVDQSIAWTIRARDLEPDNPDHNGQLAELYVDIGDFNTALLLDPGSVGLLFKMRRYEKFIDAAQLLMIEQPDDILLRYLLGFAYNATGQYALAVHVLRSTGLPKTVHDEVRQAADLEAHLWLAEAIKGAGDIELARELANWSIDQGTLLNDSWWVNIMDGCYRSLLGDDETALRGIDRTIKSVRLPWDNMLRDSPCFQRYTDEPRYQAVVRHFEARRAELLERLPATLAEYGVAL